LVEIILAMAIFAAVFTFVFGGQWSLADLVANNIKNITAERIGAVTLEEMFFRENQGVLNREPRFYGKNEYIGPFGVAYLSQGKPFNRCTHVNEHRASWRTGWGSIQKFSLSQISVDLALVTDFGLDCNNSGVVFVEPLNEEVVVLDSLVTSVDVLRGFVFVSQNSVDGIVRINTDDPHDQNIAHTSDGINRIDVTSDFVFAAVNSTTSQVAIFENNDDLSFIATTTLPGVAGSRPEAVSIFYADSKIYVGTKRTAGHEFHVFDVTNPQNPEWVGSREMNHNINDIFVKDGFAFLATSGNIRDMIVLDVRNPASMAPALVLDLPGNEDGRSIDVSYNYIFLGRHKSVVPDRPELYVFEYFFNEDSAVLTVQMVDSIKTGGDVVDIGFSDNQVFAATNNTSKEIQFFHLNNDMRLESDFDLNLTSSAGGFDADARKFFASTGNEVHIFENYE